MKVLVFFAIFAFSFVPALTLQRLLLVSIMSLQVLRSLGYVSDEQHTVVVGTASIGWLSCSANVPVQP